MLTREDQKILLRAAEGGAFQEVSNWVGSDAVTRSDLNDDALNRVYWTKLAEVAESILGRDVTWEEFGLDEGARWFFARWNRLP